MTNPKLLVICGPTASGKSDFALEIATRIGGEIVNADSMQVYKELPILTCSPSEEQKQIVNHHLYNHRSLSESYSVTKFIEEATSVIHDITQRGKTPILVGGTGLYIKSLCEGITTIPKIPEAIREKSKKLLDTIGNEAFHYELSLIDSLAASKLHPNNSQRLVRAYEVAIYTKQSIYDFHDLGISSPISNYQKEFLILNIDRSQLYENCNSRFEKLLEIGAIEEVEAIAKQFRPEEVRVIGYYEIYNYISGKISRDELIQLASQKTRRYAKRQVTFFKHQIKGRELSKADIANKDLEIF